MVRFVSLRHRGRDVAPCGSPAAPPAATRVVKFAGCYHGHADSPAGHGGLGPGDVRDPLVGGRSGGACGADHRRLPLDDDEALAGCVRPHGDEIAAVLIEPIPANAGLLLQRPEFLENAAPSCAAGTAPC